MLDFISSEYLAEQRRLHRHDKDYGSRGYNWAYLVAGIRMLEGCFTTLDYGCGKGSFGVSLRRAGIPCTDYDPGLEIFSKQPEPHDLVSCTDVLEHIEPEKIDNVIAHLYVLTKKTLFVSVCMRPAGRDLSDGRNAHILIQDETWWRQAFEKAGFRVRRVWDSPSKDQLWTALLSKV